MATDFFTNVMRSTAVAAAALTLAPSLVCAQAADASRPVIHVKSCEHFQVNGRGDAKAWDKAEWVPLQRRPNGNHDYRARIKMLYSERGVYVLFDGTDQRLTSTMQDDFLELWREDVYECFFWTDERYPVYFEYEISPLGFELPILVPNLGAAFRGWRPWQYEGERKIEKAVSVSGGQQQPMAEVTSWRAEVFFPYQLLVPLTNIPARPGTRWRANFYRVDYDDEKTTQWDWARVGRSFHEYQSYGTLIFD